MSADQHLLFGLLALQNEFIDKRQLVTAFGAWIADHTKPLDQILVEQNALQEDDRSLLSRLVDRHVAARGGDIAASLQSISSAGSVREELERLADGDVQASIAKLRPPDSNTLATMVGQSTSAGQRFEIRRPLDRGGLGIVSVAVDKELNREVALKEIRGDHADDQSYRTKFLLEAEVTGGLEHPGIVPVYGLGSGPDGRPYYAMRLIKGDNLHQHIKRFHEDVAAGKETYDGPALRKLLRRFLDVCQAIDYAHARGVLHRDLKPGNIMLGKYGETLVVDWGLAKLLGVSRRESSNGDDPDSEPSLVPSGSHDGMTMQGSIVGTAAYAPPEQLSGDLSQVNERSDVYGLGAMLYELLTGQPPAQGETLEAVIKAVLAGDIRSSRAIQPKVPKPLEAICLRAIAKRPEDRYTSAHELGQEIERWLDDSPVYAYPEPMTLRIQRWMRAHKAIVATTTAVVLMSAIGLGLLLSIVSQNNSRLADLNAKLSSRNTELQAAYEREAAARELAKKQSELAMSTLINVVIDIQSGLRYLPGSSDLRRRLLLTSLSQLELVIDDYLSDSVSDHITIMAINELGGLLLELRVADDGEPNVDKLSPETESALQLATTLYNKGLEISKKLAMADPSDAHAQRGLYISYNQIGDVSLRAGQVEEALGFYQQALEISNKLAMADPSDADAQLTLSRSYVTLGDVSRRAGRVEEALDFDQQALEITKKLALPDPSELIDPSNTLTERYLLLSSYEMLGNAKLKAGQVQEAFDFFQQVLETSMKWAMADPSDARAQESLSRSYKILGDVSLKVKQVEEALGFYQQALEVCKKLAMADPSNADAQRTLSESYGTLGAVSREVGQMQEALGYYHQELEIHQKLALAEPGDWKTQRDLWSSYEVLGYISQQLGQEEEAFGFGRQALEIAKKLAMADPSDAEKQRNLMISYRSLGGVSWQAGQITEALGFLKQAREICRKLALANPSDVSAQQDLSSSHRNLGKVSLEAGQVQEALGFYQQALEIRQKLALADPSDAWAQDHLSVSYDNLGDVHSKLLDFEAASQSYLTAIAVLRTMIEQSLNVEFSKRSLAILERKLIKAELNIAAMGDWDELLQADADSLPTLLSTRGILLLKKADWDGALQAVTKLRSLDQILAIELYSAACVYSLCAVAPEQQANRDQHLNDSLITLREAIAAGYTDFDHMAQDSDLEPLRELPEFNALFPVQKATE